jgi:hypothetical protein
LLINPRVKRELGLLVLLVPAHSTLRRLALLTADPPCCWVGSRKVRTKMRMKSNDELLASAITAEAPDFDKV